MSVVVAALPIVLNGKLPILSLVGTRTAACPSPQLTLDTSSVSYRNDAFALQFRYPSTATLLETTNIDKSGRFITITRDGDKKKGPLMDIAAVNNGNTADLAPKGKRPTTMTIHGTSWQVYEAPQAVQLFMLSSSKVLYSITMYGVDTINSLSPEQQSVLDSFVTPTN